MSDISVGGNSWLPCDKCKCLPCVCEELQANKLTMADWICEYKTALLNWNHCADHIKSLRAQLEEAQKQIDAAMKVLNPNIPESGIEDAARQVKQVAITQTGNYEKLKLRLQESQAAIRSVREHEGLTSHYPSLSVDYNNGLRAGHRCASSTPEMVEYWTKYMEGMKC